MKKIEATAQRPRQNTPLLFLLLLLVPLYGGYYDFSLFLAGGALAVLLGYTAIKRGSLPIPKGLVPWALGGLVLANLLSLPFAVSAGMALTGVLRALVWLLFFLYAATYSPAERHGILDAVAYEGAILSALSAALFLWNTARGIPDLNGRVDGFFEYANTWALFLLVCLLWLGLKEAHKKADFAAMAMLLWGIFLSGSRSVFLLGGALGLFCAVRYAVKKRRLLPLAAGLGALVLIGALAAIVSGGMVLERLFAITASSSSLNGRLLYWLDGLRMLAAHPLGAGRGAYPYLLPLFQSGVYAVQYVHNSFLQAALDGGVLGGLCMATLPLALFFRKGVSFRARVILFAMSAHAFLDFDFEFSAVVLLLLLCSSGGACRTAPLPKRPALAVGALLTLALSFFSLVCYFDFAGQTTAAYALFPADLSLAEKRLQSYEAAVDAQPLAERITQRTSFSPAAWDCLYQAAAAEDDLDAMVHAKYRYLRLRPYDGAVYQDFAALLERSPGAYPELARAAAEQLEQIRALTSPLAYRIADRPDWGFYEDVQAKLREESK